MKEPGERRALITGAGSGLGEAMARNFARAGWDVVVTDQDAVRARQVAESLREAGARVLDRELDVTCDEHWDLAVAQVTGEFGGLDLLINNAGVAAGGSLEETPFEDWQWVMDINLMGVVRGCQAFLPLLRESPQGHIVNVASYAGLAGAPGIAAYGVSKAGVVALSEMLRAELAPSGLHVSVLCPAFVQTRLLETFRSGDPAHQTRVARWMEKSGVSAEDVAEHVRRGVHKRRFLILTHGNTRFFWRLKQWFPELYFRLLVRMATRKAGTRKPRKSQ